ncbi:sulfurtransferase TusA [Buchnera aphidicola]|uniref:sulfurtransferase TusA n=1 Tax=Buchnera aphidicola TaxID=9 RepID=UPI00094D1490|nr:sulfurtransferase TusA [Buchnera aphidicola]
MKKKIDLLGLRCPDVIMILRKEIRKLKQGQTAVVVTDDVFSKKDIILFCRFMKHQLLSISYKKIPYTCMIKVGKKILI